MQQQDDRSREFIVTEKTFGLAECMFQQRRAHSPSVFSCPCESFETLSFLVGLVLCSRQASRSNCLDSSASLDTFSSCNNLLVA
eukprot:1134173-Pelagomonas_calceolata.AAC.1